jgi:hypothetical protein
LPEWWQRDAEPSSCNVTLFIRPGSIAAMLC